MKKTLVAALTTALVVGAAGTTFAAADMFSDVPADHWAYDAVTQLARDGIVEGYGDTTFKGNKEITRYEMAQLVVKAMTKQKYASESDKAMIEKLANEFKDELSDLGVRVSNVEKKVDNVKLDGILRWRFQRETDKNNGSSTDTNYSKIMFRLNTDSTVPNTAWHVKTRTEWTTDGDDAKNPSNFAMDRMYAEGPLFGGNAKIGKLPVLSYDVGFMMDNRITGMEIEWKKDKLTGSIAGGRIGTAHINNSLQNSANWSGTSPSLSYGDAQIKYQTSRATSVNAQYYYLSGMGLQDIYGKHNLQMFAVGFASRLSPDFMLSGVYSHGNASQYNNKFAPYRGGQSLNFNTNNPEKNGYMLQLNYKGINIKQANSYGAWIAYKQMPQTATVSETYVDEYTNQKGWEVGLEYVPIQYVNAKLLYFHGKDVNDGNAKRNILRGELVYNF